MATNLLKSTLVCLGLISAFSSFAHGAGAPKSTDGSEMAMCTNDDKTVVFDLRKKASGANKAFIVVTVGDKAGIIDNVTLQQDGDGNVTATFSKDSATGTLQYNLHKVLHPRDDGTHGIVGLAANGTVTIGQNQWEVLCAWWPDRLGH